jgi:hypothetical protein
MLYAIMRSMDATVIAVSTIRIVMYRGQNYSAVHRAPHHATPTALAPSSPIRSSAGPAPHHTMMLRMDVIANVVFTIRIATSRMPRSTDAINSQPVATWMANVLVARFHHQMDGLALQQTIMMAMVAIATVGSTTPTVACQMQSFLVVPRMPPAVMKMVNAFSYAPLIAVAQSVGMTGVAVVAANAGLALSALPANARKAIFPRFLQTGLATQNIMAPAMDVIATAEPWTLTAIYRMRPS